MKSLKALSYNTGLNENREKPLFAEDDFCKDGLAVSEEEYWEKYYNDPDFSYEWNNGVLEVKPMSDIKGSQIYRWFLSILECYFSTYPVGIIVNLEIGFRLALAR